MNFPTFDYLDKPEKFDQLSKAQLLNKFLEADEDYPDPGLSKSDLVEKLKQKILPRKDDLQDSVRNIRPSTTGITNAGSECEESEDDDEGSDCDEQWSTYGEADCDGKADTLAGANEEYGTDEQSDSPVTDTGGESDDSVDVSDTEESDWE